MLKAHKPFDIFGSFIDYARTYSGLGTPFVVVNAGGTVLPRGGTGT